MHVQFLARLRTAALSYNYLHVTTYYLSDMILLIAFLYLLVSLILMWLSVAAVYYSLDPQAWFLFVTYQG